MAARLRCRRRPRHSFMSARMVSMTWRSRIGLSRKMFAPACERGLARAASPPADTAMIGRSPRPSSVRACAITRGAVDDRQVDVDDQRVELLACAGSRSRRGLARRRGTRTTTLAEVAPRRAPQALAGSARRRAGCPRRRAPGTAATRCADRARGCARRPRPSASRPGPGSNSMPTPAVALGPSARVHRTTPVDLDRLEQAGERQHEPDRACRAASSRLVATNVPPVDRFSVKSPTQIVGAFVLDEQRDRRCRGACRAGHRRQPRDRHAAPSVSSESPPAHALRRNRGRRIAPTPTRSGRRRQLEREGRASPDRARRRGSSHRGRARSAGSARGRGRCRPPWSRRTGRTGARRTSSGMPGPVVGDLELDAAVGDRCVAASTVPPPFAATASAALRTRLIRHWRIWPSSMHARRGSPAASSVASVDLARLRGPRARTRRARRRAG